MQKSYDMHWKGPLMTSISCRFGECSIFIRRALYIATSSQKTSLSVGSPKNVMSFMSSTSAWQRDTSTPRRNNTFLIENGDTLQAQLASLASTCTKEKVGTS
jgi:hypothetical protein